MSYFEGDVGLTPLLGVAGCTICMLLAFSFARASASEKNERFLYATWWALGLPLPVVLAQALAFGAILPDVIKQAQA